ncbi:MAG: ankyrin repeat domain-containing protein [Fibrella sp.]|nr:ankyrin repeat domain-containing protein [Armatimonadota bacterium]
MPGYGISYFGSPGEKPAYPNATPLHLAAFDGDTETTQRLLAEGSDPDARASRGETPLLLASMNGHTGVVRALIKYGADSNLLPDEGHSALRSAIRGGHSDIVRLLLARGANPNAKPAAKSVSAEEWAKSHEQMRASTEKMERAMSALGVEESGASDILDDVFSEVPPKPPEEPAGSGPFQCARMAVASGNTETLRAVLEAGFSPDPPAGMEFSSSLLDFACTFGEGIEMVDLLLQHGADPNGGDQNTGPLLTAVIAGNLPFARRLIEAGARTDGFAMGLLSAAVTRENEEMVTFLLDRGIGVDDSTAELLANIGRHLEIVDRIRHKRGTAWLDAVKAGDIEAVRDALVAGADVHAARQHDGTALEIAAGAGNAAMVSLLLGHGADPNRTGDSGISSLHEAAISGSAEVTQLLLDGGVNVHATNRWGMTALHYAATKSASSVADLLIARGARLSSVEAVYLKRFDDAERFWSNGTPVNYTNESGATALHAAVAIGDFVLAASLLDQGAEVDACDKGDQTPLLLAIVAENIGMVRLLLERGANPAGTDEMRKTPLSRACMTWNEPIARLLLENGAPLEQPAPPHLIHPEPPKSPMAEGIRADVEKERKEAAQILPDLLATHQSIRERGITEIAAWNDDSRLWGTIRTLLEFGADPNSADRAGNSLLVFLIESDAPDDLICYALAKGASPNPAGSFRKVSLIAAIGKENISVVAALLEAGANPNGGAVLESPLQIARDRGLDEIVTLLESHGASDEKRQAILAELDEGSRIFLRPATEVGLPPSPAVPPASIGKPALPHFDFGTMRDQMRTRRGDELNERRRQLEEEVRTAEVRGG